MEEKKTQDAPDVLELLLSAEPSKLEKELKMTRLSDELGTDVIFKIRALSYNAVAEFVKGKDDTEFRIVMEGLVSPNIKDPRLLSKYNAATPKELLKNPHFLLPGEVENLSLQIERFSGYKKGIFEEITKN